MIFLLLRILILDTVHSLTIQLLDGLPNLTVFLFVVSVLEPGSPVTEIARDNKHGVIIVKVACQELSVGLLALVVGVSDHDRNQFEWLSDCYIYKKI